MFISSVFLFPCNQYPTFKFHHVLHPLPIYMLHVHIFLYMNNIYHAHTVPFFQHPLPTPSTPQYNPPIPLSLYSLCSIHLFYAADTDECLDESNCVGGKCMNTPGSYNCFCPPPMMLMDKRCVFAPPVAGKNVPPFP